MKSKKIIIGSRGSKLALIYAERAKTKILEFCPNVEIKKITTSGDINQKDRLSEIGGKGLFSKQIENELLSENVCMIKDSHYILSTASSILTFSASVQKKIL